MPTKNDPPEVAAHQSVYAALKDLDVETRRRVLASVLALLGMGDVTPASDESKMGNAQEIRSSSQPAVSSRPISLIELMHSDRNARARVVHTPLTFVLTALVNGRSHRRLSGPFCRPPR